MPNEFETPRDIRIRCPLPEKLSLGDDAVGQWNFFKQQFEDYMILSDMNQAREDQKLAFLRSLLDKTTMDIVSTFKEEEKKNVATLLKRLDVHIQGTTNVTRERFIFNSTSQHAGQSFSDFLVLLKRLIKQCPFCVKCKPSLLLDRIIIGLHNKELNKEVMRLFHDSKESDEKKLQRAIDFILATEKSNDSSTVFSESAKNVNKVMTKN